MLGVKRFFYIVLKIVVFALVGATLYILFDKGIDNEMAAQTGLFGLIAWVVMLVIRHTTKCPDCKKFWVAKRISDEDLGSSSGVFSKKSGDTYHQYEKHKHLLSFQCTSCGHEWQKTEERDHRLD